MHIAAAILPLRRLPCGSEMIQESNLSNFKSQVQSSQKHNFSLLQRETKKFGSDIEKMRSEMRYEIDKVKAEQRVDFNLERGRTRDELANQNAKITNLNKKFDREIHAVRDQVEAAKYGVIKHSKDDDMTFKNTLIIVSSAHIVQWDDDQ
ncbi:protein FMP32, mitochondrial [Senna tora]|uniref:Protein FMP32, mitochondrial n=1 Tax=Senna tora TaxID=362788 RepID=A0A835CHR9_9FABA|nr:protein FMP32, mitochondrial [Senna tora]